MQWFLKEQVEEVATMSALLKVVERSRDRPMDVEEYLAREHSARGRRPDGPAGRGRGAVARALTQAPPQHARCRPAGAA